MEDDLSRQYWDAYNLARTVHDVVADVQPRGSARAAFVQVTAIDYERVAKVDADFRCVCVCVCACVCVCVCV